MKKITLSIVAAMFLFSAEAQLTQANHAPMNGDTYQMYRCDSLGIVPGPGGANSNWTYAMATHSSVLLTYNVNSSSNAMFPSATVSVSAQPNNISYFNSNSTGLMFYGGNITAGSNVAAVTIYTAPAAYAAYPMNLNTSTTTATSGSINITLPLTTSGTFTGTANAIADGTGTLNLPGNTYNNVTRVNITQTVNFTTGLGNGSMNQILFEYYQAGIKAPVFIIEAVTVVTPFGTNTQTLVSRAVPPPTSTVGLNSNFLSQEIVSVFPSPANGELQIVTKGIDASTIQLYDISGKMVAEKTLLQTTSLMDVSGLQNGIYFYTLNSEKGNRLVTGKLVITH